MSDPSVRLPEALRAAREKWGDEYVEIGVSMLGVHEGDFGIDIGGSSKAGQPIRQHLEARGYDVVYKRDKRFGTDRNPDILVVTIADGAVPIDAEPFGEVDDDV